MLVPRSNAPYDGLPGPTPFLPFNYTYQELTEGVEIKPFHSHNDYLQNEPLFDALRTGVESLEADLWYFSQGTSYLGTYTDSTGKLQPITWYYRNDEVYIGHEQTSLNPIKTLNNLYLNPLESFLDAANPSAQTKREESPLEKRANALNGVYYSSPQQPLYFLLDIKNDGDQTLKAIQPLFQPFIDKGYLAYYDTDSNQYVDGPLVITLSGNQPTNTVENIKGKRYYFLDAPLTDFTSGNSNGYLSSYEKYSQITSSGLSDVIGDLAYIGAANNAFTSSQKTKIGNYINRAHQFNLKTRVWGDPAKGNTLNSHLTDLYNLGSDLLNVDDLAGATALYESIKK